MEQSSGRQDNDMTVPGDTETEDAVAEYRLTPEMLADLIARMKKDPMAGLPGTGTKTEDKND